MYIDVCCRMCCICLIICVWAISVYVCLYKFITWKEDFESQGLKVNIRNAKVMVIGGIIKGGLSKSRVDSCEVCSLRIRLTQFFVYIVVSGSTVDVTKKRSTPLSFINVDIHNVYMPYHCPSLIVH